MHGTWMQIIGMLGWFWHLVLAIAAAKWWWLCWTNALLSAKWSMELGMSQKRQMLWLAAGLLLGPLALLNLYIRLLRQRMKEDRTEGEARRALARDLQGM